MICLVLGFRTSQRNLVGNKTNQSESLIRIGVKCNTDYDCGHKEFCKGWIWKQCRRLTCMYNFQCLSNEYCSRTVTRVNGYCVKRRTRGYNCMHKSRCFKKFL